MRPPAGAPGTLHEQRSNTVEDSGLGRCPARKSSVEIGAPGAGGGEGLDGGGITQLEYSSAGLLPIPAIQRGTVRADADIACHERTKIAGLADLIAADRNS